MISLREVPISKGPKTVDPPFSSKVEKTDFYQFPINSGSNVDRLKKITLKFKELQSKQSLQIGNLVFINPQLSMQFTLGDLRACQGHSIQTQIIQNLQLEQCIEKITKKCPLFYKKLNETCFEVLDKVTLFSFQIQMNDRFEHSGISDILMKDEDFLNISIHAIHYPRDLQIITLKLNQIYANRAELIAYVSENIRWHKDPCEISVGKLRLISSKNLLEIINKIPEEALGLITDEQMKDLDFFNLSSKQITSCICGGLNDKKTVERRFNLLTQQTAMLVVKKIDFNILYIFPIVSFYKLSIFQLSKEQIEALFIDPRLSLAEQKERISKVSSQEINAILHQLKDDFLQHLSDFQIQNLDYSLLKKEQLISLFSHTRIEKSEQIRKISLIPPPCLCLIIDKVSPEILMGLSIDQILALNIAILKREQVRDIFFPDSIEEEQIRRKIYAMTSSLISILIDLEFFNVLKYISDAQLSVLSIEKLSRQTLKILFPPLDPSKFYSDCFYSFESGSHVYERNGTFKMSYLKIDQKKMNLLIDERKAICIKNLKILPLEKVNLVKDKISPEVRKFLIF